MSGKNFLEQAKELLKHIQENPSSIKSESSDSVLDQAKTLLKHITTDPESVKSLTKTEVKSLTKKEEIKQAVMQKWEPRYGMAKAAIFDFKSGKKMADMPTTQPSAPRGQLRTAAPTSATSTLPKTPAAATPAAKKPSLKPSTGMAKKAPGEEQPKDISDSPVGGKKKESISKAAPGESGKGLWYHPSSLANKGNKVAQQHATSGLKEGSIVNLRNVGPHRVAATEDTGSGVRYWMVPHNAAPKVSVPTILSPSTVQKQPRSGVRPSALKALISKAETKHDRCVEGVSKDPSVKNPHAVCVAAGVKPSGWKKSEIQAMVKEEWSPKFAQKGVHKPISEGSGHSKAGMLSPGAKPGSADAEAAKEEHKKVLAEQKEMKTK